VEQHPDGALLPVEFKLGKRRKWENDDAQLCAQALCLEEMLGRPLRAARSFTPTANAGAKWNSPPELRAAHTRRTFLGGSCMNCSNRNRVSARRLSRCLPGMFAV
jgi:hypothetical protein